MTPAVYPDMPVRDPGEGGVMVGHKVLEGIVEECLSDFKAELRGEIQDMHLELLRQFHIQKNELEAVFQKYAPSQALMDEVKALREENARLRCGFLE
ncbi:Protein nedd1 [Irineochytrium annulatum]|nr:Protein nedd1 [Irineochytrium annulatum]